jgi:hypothetical protein
MVSREGRMEMPEFWPSLAAKFLGWPPADEIAAVRALIGDPPAVVPDVDWDGVHARLGLRLPADYRAFPRTRRKALPASAIDDRCAQ